MELPTEKRKFPPGVRFHPTDVELLLCYLMSMVLGLPFEAGFVAEVEIYKFHPADLKALACFREELNWYFFCSADNKYKSGGRRNRATPCGYWKPTGNDRVVIHEGRVAGYVKTLVFHEGKPAKGERTDWVMHEYRLEKDGESAKVVLCKIFKKGGLGPRNGEQFGAPYNAMEYVPTAEHAQISSTEMNEDDPVSANANALTIEHVPSGANAASTSNGAAFEASTSHTNEQVFSGAVLQSEICLPPTPTSNAANVASTSHGVTLYANPFHGNPISGSDIPSSSMGPMPDQYEDMFHTADFEVEVSGGPVEDPFNHMLSCDDFGFIVVPANANTITTEQVWSGASAASTANGFAFAATPSRTAPIAPPDIVSGSIGPVGYHIDEMWCTDDVDMWCTDDNVGDVFHNNNVLDAYFTEEDFFRQFNP